MGMIATIKRSWALILFICGVIIVLANFMGATEKLSETWSKTFLSDYFRSEPVSGKARVLVAAVRHDENGRYTAEIREMLRREGKRYRMLGREYREEDETGNWVDLENLLERHKSVILLEGSVAADGKTIRIRVRNRDGRIDKRAEIELDNSSSWTEKLSKMIVEGTQELVDSTRAEPRTIEEYEELAGTVRDAITQSDSEEERHRAEFQLAFIEGDIAFLNKDTEGMLKALEGYEKLLEKYEGEHEEGPIRYNIGTAYEIVGGVTGDATYTQKAKEEFKKAEEIYEEYGNIEKALKARTAKFRIERRQWFEEAKKGGEKDLSILTEMSDSISSTLKLHADKITGFQGWLSNEERLYIDLLWAAATKDRAKYERAKDELVKAREYFWEQVKKSGDEKNPWVLSVLAETEEWQAEQLWADEEMGK